MSRRRAAFKRNILPDPIYNEIVVTKFINCLMKDGKKNTAEKVFYKSLKKLEGKTNDVSLIDLFKTCLKNVMPRVEVKSRRVGGSTYQVPVEVRDSRKQALAIRWLIVAARNRGGNSMIENLSSELLDAFQNRGSAVKKKEDTHRMAEANKAFAHYVW